MLLVGSQDRPNFLGSTNSTKILSAHPRPTVISAILDNSLVLIFAQIDIEKVKENILNISLSRFTTLCCTSTCIYLNWWLYSPLHPFEYISDTPHADVCNGCNGYISDIPGADVCNGCNPPSVAASASSVPPNSKAGLARGKTFTIRMGHYHHHHQDQEENFENELS